MSIFIQKLLGHFSWPRINTQRENRGNLIHLENFHLFGEHDWKIRKAFPQLDGKYKKAGVSDK